MTARIEIIGAEGESLRAALYYPVPPAAYLPASADPARTPAGSALDAAELQELKDGRLVEWMQAYTFPVGTSLGQIATRLEADWASSELQAQVLREYKTRWTFANEVGRWWDGDIWR